VHDGQGVGSPGLEKNIIPAKNNLLPGWLAVLLVEWHNDGELIFPSQGALVWRLLLK
jgi:hypothetical protein